MWELEHDPERMALRILTLRGYAETKALVDRAEKEADMPKGEMAQLVLDIEAELVREQSQAAIAKRLAALADDDEDEE